MSGDVFLIWCDTTSASGDQSLRAVWEHRWDLSLFETALLILAGIAFWSTLAFFDRSRLNPWRRMTLAALRTIAWCVLLFMLAQWTFSRQKTERPGLAVFLDDSLSMATVDRVDEAAAARLRKRIAQVGSSTASRLELAKTLFLERDAELWKELSARYRPEVFLVSESLANLRDSPDKGSNNVGLTPEEFSAVLKPVRADGSSSRLGGCIMEFLEQRRGNPPAAVVILSDGIVTTGPSLAEASASARRVGVPLYCIGIGQEVVFRDVELDDVIVEENAWVDEYVAFEAVLNTQGMKNRKVELTLTTPEGTVLARETTMIESDRQTLRPTLLWRPTRAGDYTLTLKSQPFEDESRKTNNERTVVVHVREQTIRVLLVGGEPSYDYRFLKELFAREKLVDLRVVLQDADVEFVETDPQGKRISLRTFPLTQDDLAQFDVVILVDADPAKFGSAAVSLLSEHVKTGGAGLVMLAGIRHWPRQYLDGPLAELVPVEPERLAWGNPITDPTNAWRMTPTGFGFSRLPLRIEDDPARNVALWRTQIDPLFNRLENIVVRPAAQVLIDSRGSRDESTQPLVVERISGAGRVLWHGTDETWRLRSGNNGLAFSRYWLQTLRELARSRLFRREQPWRLTADRRTYAQGDSTELTARVMTAGIEPPNGKITIAIVSESGATQRRELRRERSVHGEYRGDAMRLPAGRYTASIVEPAGLTVTTEWQVLPPANETERLGIDIVGMTRAAQESNGRYASWNDAQSIWPALPSGKATIIETTPKQALWNRWPIFASACAMLIAEWWLRKRWGLA